MLASAVVTHEQGGRVTSWWMKPAPRTELDAIKVSCGAVEAQQWTTTPAQRLGTAFAGWPATSVAFQFGKTDLTMAEFARLQTIGRWSWRCCWTEGESGRVVVGGAAMDIVAGVASLEVPHDIKDVRSCTVHVVLNGFVAVTKRIQGKDGKHGWDGIPK